MDTDHGQRPEQVEQGHERDDGLRDCGHPLQPAQYDPPGEQGQYNARCHRRHPEHRLQIARNGVDLAHVPHAEAGQHAKAGKQHRQCPAKAAAQPLGQIVHGPAAPSSGGIPAAVADAQHVLGIAGHHPQQGHDPHPEHSPRPACQNGRRHAHDVAGADGRRQRRAKALELADGFIVRVGGHIPVQEDGPDGVPHPVPEIPQLEKTGAHCQQAAGAKQQCQPHRPPYHTADHRIHPRQALPHTQTPPVLYCMAQGAFSCPGSGFCIKKRIPAHPVPKQNGGTRDAQERLEALLGCFGGGTSGAAAAGGRHSPAHPADGAHPHPDRPAPERGAHPAAPGRAPDDPASLHRRGAAGLFAGLPERRSEQSEPAGRAGGADGSLQRRDCQPCPLLRSGGARPVPSGASGGAGPAGGYALSGAVPRRAGKDCFPLRAGAGGVFGGTDCR